MILCVIQIWISSVVMYILLHVFVQYQIVSQQYYPCRVVLIYLVVLLLVMLYTTSCICLAAYCFSLILPLSVVLFSLEEFLLVEGPGIVIFLETR